MSTPQSDFMRVLTERGFVHQCSDPEGLDERAKAGGLTGYIGFDCTAPSLHVGSLVQIMMLFWLQQTGGKPIALMGGGTTRVGDPSGKDESRKLLTVEQIEENKQGIKTVFSRFLRFGDGPERRDHARQRRLADEAQLHRIPARRRPAFLRQPHAVDGIGEAAPRSRPGAVLHRIQLHDPAGLRLRRALPALWLRPADGRLRSMGQHRQRHRPRPPDGNAAALCPDDAADHHRLGRQDGQDRGRRDLAQPGDAEPLRLLAVLAQHRGCRCRALPQAVHDADACRDRAARSARRVRDQRGEEGAGDRGDGAPARPRSRRRRRPRRRARPSRRARSPRVCRPCRCRGRCSRPGSAC